MAKTNSVVGRIKAHACNDSAGICADRCGPGVAGGEIAATLAGAQRLRGLDRGAFVWPSNCGEGRAPLLRASLLVAGLEGYIENS